MIAVSQTLEEWRLRMEDSRENAEKKKAAIREWIILILIFLLSLFLVPKVITRSPVFQTSMEDTLKEGDNLLVEKVSRHFTDPKRFDIVILKISEEENYVKRVIGLPGETVQIIDGIVHINGQPLEKDYGKQPITYPGIAKDAISLAEDEFFVLGDNREVSADSREEWIGPIKKKQIEGRAILRIWPINKFGVVD